MMFYGRRPILPRLAVERGSRLSPSTSNCKERARFLLGLKVVFSVCKDDDGMYLTITAAYGGQQVMRVMVRPVVAVVQHLPAPRRWPASALSIRTAGGTNNSA
jgi:hypothetical protein